MAITAKEIVIILLGITGSVILGLLFNIISFEITKIKDYLIMLGVLIITIVALIFIIYKKFNEVDKELANQKSEQKKLNEKLKIYKRLSKLEEKIFKNGN